MEKWEIMESWEVAANCFGRYYTLFILIVANSAFFMICLSAAWTSPVLLKLSGMEDNPLGKPISNEESDLIGSLFYIGAALSPFLFIKCVDKFGRKNVLVLLTLLLPISFATASFATRVELYYISRILLGVYTGAALSIEPVYVSEILPSDKREFMMSFLSYFNFSGILTAYVVGSFTSIFYFNMFLTIFSFFLFLLLWLGCPESPYNKIQEGKVDEARKILSKLGISDVEQELTEIIKSATIDIQRSFWSFFQSSKNIKLFVAATVPVVLQQLSGMPILVTYSALIFEKTNISIPSSYCSILVVCLQILTGFLTPTMLKSKKFTIKSLLILSSISLAICNLLICFYFYYEEDIAQLHWLPLVGLILFVVLYNCGLDSIPWMLLGEIYPTNISSVGTALSSSAYLIAIFPILYSFTKVDISYLFLGSAISCIVGAVFVHFVFSKFKDSKK